MNIRTQEPLLLPLLARALGCDDFDNRFHGSFRQVDTDEQQPADPGQIGFGKASADKGKPQPELADRFAMTSRWLGIRDLPGHGVSVDQGNGGWEVGVITRATTAVS